VDLADITPLSGEAEPGQTEPLVTRRDLGEDEPAAKGERATLLATRIPSEIFASGLHQLYLLRNDLLFTGRMIVPPTPEGARRRLIVREYERHFGDFTVTDSTPIGQVTRPGIAERLVFAREFYVLGYVPDEQANGETAPQ
jgi:hypothetical protein